MNDRLLAVVRTYDELWHALRERAEELNISRESIDATAGLPAGYSGKLLGEAQVKRVGPSTLEPLLGSLGLALIVVEDDTAAHYAARMPKRSSTRATGAPRVGYSRSHRMELLKQVCVALAHG